MLFGKGETRYTYSFSESSNGYLTTYLLSDSGKERSLSLENPLSSKRAYFLENDTILCVAYSGTEACSSVAGNAEVANYLNSLRAKFLNDTVISRNEMDARYLISKRYIRMDPNITKTTVAGHGCDEIRYRLDMTNVSVDEAARFGVGTTTPRVFDWRICVDNKTGYVYERTFNYTYKGIAYASRFQLLSFSRSPQQIIPPQNMSGDPVALLFKEREQTVKLAVCFTDKSGDERDKCIAGSALELRRKDLCELAGGRRDRCLVSIVPLTKDKDICNAVKDASFKDDCFIELAGAYKDKSYCVDVKDPSKAPLCEQAATPNTPVVPEGNLTGNMTTTDQTADSTSGFNATSFMNTIDRRGENVTNATGPASTNGSE
jgi:hypothetical protein